VDVIVSITAGGGAILTINTGGGAKMREIRFRAWDKFADTPIMVYFDLDMLQERKTLLVDSVVDTDLMQFTGLVDHCGKDIYEGDVVASRTDNHVVFYDEQPAYYRTRSLTNGTMQSLSQWINEQVPVNDLEVIGNICENPELLDKPHD
jgi:uncharacterized phage protein (TIGR01671 family)